MDDGEEFMPDWTNMNKKVPDSEDMPLNRVRETLQQNLFKKKLAKKWTVMFAEIAEKKDEYQEWHEQYGKCLKLDVHKDPTNNTKKATWVGARWSRAKSRSA
mmetsp:Transcript_125283/g.362482  ORF Transcript_125283/g.362482 Transcript_125283/m.362482 type:complete len:102 (+) Transcript_125283:222-527(+)